MYYSFFVCICLKNSIFGEFSIIYLLSAQNCVKWRHKIRPIVINFRPILIFFFHETTPNWCPEKCAKFHVDTVRDEEVIPEKSRGVGSDPPPGGGRLIELRMVYSKKCEFRWPKGQARSRKKGERSQIKKIENFEIAKSWAGSLRFQRYIVLMGLDNVMSYWPLKKGL